MSDSLGLYVHVPFCSSKCDYCAFATWTNSDKYFVNYFQALDREFQNKKRSGTIREASSLYIGGGTPSLVAADYIANLLNNIDLREGAEVTIECNPESTTAEKLMIYRDSGINRVSFGVQSMSSQTLAMLGRHHEVDDIYGAVEAIGSVGLNNYSVDIIYGAAGETLSSIEDSLFKVLRFSPPPLHISAYALTVEPGTTLYKDPSRYPDDDYQAAAYDLIDAILKDHGYEWYEISNWAKPGFHSRHNWNYWVQGDYVGLGCGAHSHLGNVRSSNIFNFKRYIDAVFDEENIEASQEETEDIVSEALELLVRTRVGIPFGSLPSGHKVGHLLESSKDRFRLNREGRRLANQVMLRIDSSDIEFEQIKAFQARDPWEW